jgi:16S rRNA (guanine(966)-N(2))-methyltransferase RsmD
MRVIAGTLKGRQLKAPTWEGLRPTSDRLRETLFNVLAPRVAGARFLDLYSGSGAVGIEALSRGASEVVAVESHKKAVRVIEHNLASLGVDHGFQLIAAEVMQGLRQLSGGAFDLIFLDPPYREHGAYEQVMRLIAELGLLAPNGLIIAEHEKHFDPGDALASFRRTRTLRQGDAVLSFYPRD